MFFEASLSSLRNGSRSCLWLVCPATPMARNIELTRRSRRFAQRLESRFGIEDMYWSMSATLQSPPAPRCGMQV